MKAYHALAVALSSLVLCSYANADVIYENGNFSGADQGATISSPQFISDSFTVSAKANLTTATVGLWTAEGSSPVSLTWSISKSAFGTDIASGTATLSNSQQIDYGDAEVFLSSFNLGTTLGAGTYYFTLGNATSTSGDSVGWDVNFGPSKAFYKNDTDPSTPTDSEYFKLEGNLVSDTGGGTPLPEPASLAIFGAGLLGVAAVRRRRNGSR